MLSAGELAGMRATAEAALPDLCAIERNIPVSDGGGGTTESWTEHAASVPCRIAPSGGGETGTAGDRVEDETTHVATLPAGADVEEADRLTVDGVMYEVTLVRKRSWEITRRVELKEQP